MESPRSNTRAPHRHHRDAAYWRAHHGTLPARAIHGAETDIDEADACELGSQAALDQIRRVREVERR
jgi:hypothetical protein